MQERRTPLYDVHKRMSADMVQGGGGYMFPLSYTSPMQEHINTRTNVGIQDLSSMGEVDIKGPGAERLLNYLLVNETRDLQPGRLRYSTVCNERGGVVDDVTVYKFNDEHFMVVTSSGPRKKTARWLAEHAMGTSTYVTDISGAIALISVQGPSARDLVKAVLSDANIDALRFFRFSSARCGDTELTVSRSGYTGELGYELYVPAEEAALVWQRLLSAGGNFGLLPYGVAAMQSLRTEKAYPLYGNDINEDYTPFHVGLDRWIRFDKPQFVGRDALLEVQERGPDHRWVGLVLDSAVAASVGDRVSAVGDVVPDAEEIESGPEAGREEDRILPGREPLGQITFSTKGHSVGEMLAMAYVRTSHSWPGAKLVVSVGGRPVPAVVTQTPFFDPQGARLRG
jgi:aminomethyltransferase